ncbi:MAG: hypothetical protein RR824_08300 [Clostridia bacterium]
MNRASNSESRGAKRLLCLLCFAALLISVLPLYAISVYNHPYYDDYGFSVKTHQAWEQTESLPAVLSAAVQSAKEVRGNWQGTYTGTLLSNLQPGVISENLYLIGNLFLLTAFLLCFGFFFRVLCKEWLGLDAYGTIMLTCLALTLMVQFMPDTGEAFYWFNGGIGNTFIYSLLALSLAFTLKLLRLGEAQEAKPNHARLRGTLLTLALALLMVLLGGGSYGGGLFGLCLYALLVLWAFGKGNRSKWPLLALWVLFLTCFLYSVTAPGNAVRAEIIGHQASAIKAVAQALYYGVAQIGGYIRLPLLAVSAMVAPLCYRAAQKSRYAFQHPVAMLFVMICLFCTQLAPPLYSGVFIGGGRIVNTYFQSFVVLWFLCLYYLLGYAAKRVRQPIQWSRSAQRGLAVVSLCTLLVGCLGYKRPSDTMYGVQNMAGMSAAISLLNGEAKQYDREMRAREALLNDDSQPVITLAPLSSVPKVFMPDLLCLNAQYDVRPALCEYYAKQSIAIAGEEVTP